MLRLPIPCLALAALLLTASCGPSESRQPDLPKQPDRWLDSIVLDAESKATYVGKTRDYIVTTSSEVRDLGALRTIRVGEEIEGIRIGAIKCSFFWRDATYGGEQYMWRGRWGCQAGRSKQEIQSAVEADGEKRFDYIHAAPVRLDAP